LSEQNRGRRRGGRSSGGKPAAARTHEPRAEPLHPSTDVPDIKLFREWALEPTVQDAIEAMGISVPTPVQCLSIQHVLDGRDVIAKAETGTGKTLAFGAPFMSKIDPARASVLGLVLTPTRELAQQVASVLEALGKPRNIRVALIVGGEPLGPQVEALKAGAQVVVGTPGRVIDLYGQRFLSFPWTEFVVLDEADEMLEIGFIDDVKKILSYTPEERQTMLFSATFPSEVLRLARESTRNPVEIATAAGVATVKTIEQVWMNVGRNDRALVLTRLMEQTEGDDVLLVFCDRRTEVDALMRQLERLPFSVKALHGGYDQAARFRVMSAFRTGEVKALVATDVASRGLDVQHVTHVINYSVPRDVQDYTHRIGRTGRAGRKGTAITFVTPEQVSRWHAIERSAPWKIAEIGPPGRSSRGTSYSVHARKPEAPAEVAREPRDAVQPAAPPAHARHQREASAEGRDRPPRREHAESRERHAPRERAPHREPRAPRPPEGHRGPAEKDQRHAPHARPQPAAAAENRPRRSMTTRERLALERGQPDGSKPEAPASPPAAAAHDERPRRRRR
jgi:superfamily II DNA/RNA helicase